MTIREDEAALIREAADRVLQGATVRSVVTTWKAAKVPTVTGTNWTPTTVKRLLISPRIAGLRAHHGQAPVAATWPAIITPEQSERLRAVLTNPARRANGTVAPRSYLLAGLLVCGGCGVRMVSRPPRPPAGTSAPRIGAGAGGAGLGLSP